MRDSFRGVTPLSPFSPLTPPEFSRFFFSVSLTLKSVKDTAVSFTSGPEPTDLLRALLAASGTLREGSASSSSSFSSSWSVGDFDLEGLMGIIFAACGERSEEHSRDEERSDELVECF